MGDILLEFGGYKTLISKRELISRVKEHRFLWDKQHPIYKDKKTKAAAWKELCKKMTPAWETLDGHTRTRLASEIIRKWQHIRDAYVKYMRISRVRPTKPYLFSSMLTFLNPFIEAERKNDIAESISEALESKEYILIENNCDEDVDELETESTWYSNRTDIKNEAQDVNEAFDYDTIVNVLANVIQREDDEDKAFFNSLTPQVKLLSNDSKIQFRIEVLKVLQNLLHKDNNASESTFIEERLASDNE